MPHTKRAKRKGRKEAMPAAGVVGVVSLLLAGGASAATAIPTPSQRTAPPQITLSEEEIADVSLGTFYVFDTENARTPRLRERVAQAQRGCRGCGCRGCGRCRNCPCRVC
jgi:hypothetical protein